MFTDLLLCSCTRLVRIERIVSSSRVRGICRPACGPQTFVKGTFLCLIGGMRYLNRQAAASRFRWEAFSVETNAQALHPLDRRLHLTPEVCDPDIKVGQCSCLRVHLRCFRCHFDSRSLHCGQVPQGLASASPFGVESESVPLAQSHWSFCTGDSSLDFTLLLW